MGAGRTGRASRRVLMGMIPMRSLSLLALIAVAAMPLASQQARAPNAQERVFVIAVKATGDASIFSRCATSIPGSRGASPSYKPTPFPAPELFPCECRRRPRRSAGPDDQRTHRGGNSCAPGGLRFLNLSTKPTWYSFVEAHFSSWIELSGPRVPVPPDMSGGGAGKPPTPPPIHFSRGNRTRSRTSSTGRLRSLPTQKPIAAMRRMSLLF